MSNAPSDGKTATGCAAAKRANGCAAGGLGDFGVREGAGVMTIAGPDQASGWVSSRTNSPNRGSVKLYAPRSVLRTTPGPRAVRRFAQSPFQTGPDRSRVGRLRSWPQWFVSPVAPGSLTVRAYPSLRREPESIVIRGAYLRTTGEGTMAQRAWPHELDGLIDRARFGPGEDFWASAERTLQDRSPDQATRYLAILGLAELVTQVHRVDRDSTALCAGDELARALFAPRA